MFKEFVTESAEREELIQKYDQHHGRYRSGDEAWANQDSSKRKLSSEYKSHMKHFYPHELDAKKLAKLPGKNDEHLQVGKEGHWNDRFEEVKASMKKHGFKRQIDDGDYSYSSGVMIRVQHDGKAVVHEGNKRLRAAAALGIKTVPVRWEFEGKSGYSKTAKHPVDFMTKEDREKLRDTNKLEMNEQAPTMAIGNGQIAGTVEAGDKPPVFNRAWERYKKKNRKNAPKDPILDPMARRRIQTFKDFWS